MSADNLHRSLQRFIDGCTKTGDPPGAAWSVGAVSQVWATGISGSAALVPDRDPLSTDTLFDLASLTKPLATALSAVLLEQDGELDLDAPLGEWMPESRSTPYATASLLALGSHRAGLPAWEPLYAGETDSSRFQEKILSLPVAAEPGETLYSDLGYILLGKVLETVSELSLDRLFARRVAGQAGLAAAFFPGIAGAGARAAATERGNRYERDLAGDRGAGYHFREGMIRGQVHDGNAWAMGGVAGHAGLFATLDDVATLAVEILAPSRLDLGDRARRRLLAPVAEGGRTFGFETASCNSAVSTILPDRAPGHTGFTGTSLWIDPQAGRYWILLTNRVHPAAVPERFQEMRRQFHRLSAGPVPQ